MSADDTAGALDVILIGAGIMSATLGVFLKELEPSLSVEMFETLEGAGLESSEAWNNAGTGHAANCELNYTPERADGSIDISKALQVAGQRVQIIKPDVKRSGLLEFGTELVAAADRSLVALLGASPGASTAAFMAISALEKCFASELTPNGWLPKLKEIIPSYGISLIEDADLLRRIRADTAAVLKVENV